MDSNNDRSAALDFDAETHQNDDASAGRLSITGIPRVTDATGEVRLRYAALAVQFEPPVYYWGERLPHIIAVTGFLTFSLFFDSLGIAAAVLGYIMGGGVRLGSFADRHPLALAGSLTVIGVLIILQYSMPTAEMLRHWIISLVVWVSWSWYWGRSIGRAVRSVKTTKRVGT